LNFAALAHTLIHNSYMNQTNYNHFPLPLVIGKIPSLIVGFQ